MSCAQRGFTLIEVLVALAVLGILIALGVPTMGEWLQAQRIRAGAEAIVNGMQVARGEAIKQNLPVVFGLEPPTTGWTVCTASLAPCDSTTPAGGYIQNRSGQEGSRDAQVLQTPAGATLVTFSPLGAVLSNNLDGTLPLTQIDVYNNDPALCSANGGTTRCLRVVVSAGGSIRMCDPTPGIVAPDTRACP
jgi:type IV fimbrial biogenesis protein FimT